MFAIDPIREKNMFMKRQFHN